MKARFTHVGTIMIEIDGNEAERVLLDNFIKDSREKGIWISGNGSLDGKTNTLFISVKKE